MIVRILLVGFKFQRYESCPNVQQSFVTLFEISGQNVVQKNGSLRLRLCAGGILGLMYE
jgi:hypothetical protein